MTRFPTNASKVCIIALLLLIVHLESQGRTNYVHCGECEFLGVDYAIDQNIDGFSPIFTFEGPLLAGGIRITHPDGSIATIGAGGAYADPNFYPLDEFLTYKFRPLNYSGCELEISMLSLGTSDETPPYNSGDFSCHETNDIPYEIVCLSANTFQISLDLETFKTGLADVPDNIEIVLPNNQKVNVADADYFLDETVYFLHDLGELQYSLCNNACSARTGCIDVSPGDLTDCSDEFSPECFSLLDGLPLSLDGTVSGTSSILQHGLISPSTDFPQGYITIVAFNSDQAVATSLLPLLASEELGLYMEGYDQFYQFTLEDICLNADGEYLLLVTGGYDDLLAPFENKIVARMNELGEILGSEIYIGEANTELSYDFPCAEGSSNVTVSTLDGEGSALYQQEEFIIETNFADFAGYNALNYKRYHEQNPPGETLDIGITDITFDSYTHYFTESDNIYGYGYDCVATLDGINIEVTNVSNTEVCYLELQLRRSYVSLQGNNYNSRNIEVFDCIEPGESIIVHFSEPWTMADANCNDKILAILKAPNGCWDVNNEDNFYTAEATLDENFCPDFNAYVGTECIDDNGDSSFITDECECGPISGVSDLESSFVIGPNPTEDYLYINAAAPFELWLYSIDGKLLLRNEYNLELSIDLRGFSKGTYFLQLQTETGSLSKKLIRN